MKAAGGVMRPFYRKDLFREDIITSSPMEHKVKIDSEEMCFETLKMEKGQSIELSSDEYEVGIVILSGMITMQAGEFVAEHIGQRKDVFSGKPTAVYIPCETDYQIKATGYGIIEMVLCKLKAKSKGKPFVLMPEDIETKVQGVFNWKRRIHEIMVGGKAGRLIIGESYGCPGTWAVYPYKDDQNKSIFHFRLSPNQNKRVQVMRDMSNPKAYYVQNNTTLMMQNTYEPIPEIEKYQVYYLWFKIMS